MKKNIKVYKNKTCIVCKKVFTFQVSKHPNIKFCSDACFKGYFSKENNFNWKGKSASYSAFHNYLINHYGNPLKCEHCKEVGKKGLGGRWNIDWALKKSFSHAQKRENYLGLCRSCHIKYDMTTEKRNFRSKVAKKFMKKLSRNKLGQFVYVC